MGACKEACKAGARGQRVQQWPKGACTQVAQGVSMKGHKRDLES